MQTYRIESEVNEIRMHTLQVNGAPCVIVVYPDGMIDVNAPKVSSAEPEIKAPKQPKPVPAQKAPKKKKSLLASLVGGSGKPQNTNWIKKMSEGPDFGNGPRF